LWGGNSLPDIITNILVAIIVGLVLAYVGYRYGIRRFWYERKISKLDEETRRNETLLYHLKKINIAANEPSIDQSKELMQKASQWFDENCQKYKNDYPYKEFEQILKCVNAYITSPDLLVEKSLEMFEKITDLREKLKGIIKNEAI